MNPPLDAPQHLLAIKDISGEIGHHITVTVLGVSLNIDTIWSSALAAIIVIALGLFLRSRITSSGVPSKLQLAWEGLVNFISGQVKDQIGDRLRYVMPLAVTIFTFLLVANWISVIPTQEKVPAPASDVNLPAAMAIAVIIWMHVASIRARGFGGYIKHYFQPFPVLAPLNAIEEIAKPISLALRLFGNLFSGTILVLLIGLFPVWLVPFPNAAWKLFDLFVGAIQALIFALLTIVYFGMGTDTEAEH